MVKENLNTVQAAKFLCISQSKLMKMTHRKEVRYHKVGRRNVFDINDLLEYLEKNTVFTNDDLQKQAEDLLLKNKGNNIVSALTSI
jgi:excisionase family DNA binding protein